MMNQPKRDSLVQFMDSATVLHRHAGFTLIELLVVIAIIGILSSVVMANVNSARTKGGDASIKSDLSNARSQAELFHDEGQTYTGVCTTPTVGIGTHILGAATILSPSAIVGDTSEAFAYNLDTSQAGAAVCHDSDLGWAAVVSLRNPSTPDSGWCVDHLGNAAETTILTADSVVCGE